MVEFVKNVSLALSPVKMATSSDDYLVSLLDDAKRNNSEALRLVKSVKFASPFDATTLAMNSNSTRKNIGWIDTHLCHTQRKLDEIDEKFLQWKVTRDAYELASNKCVNLKCLYLEEKRRTASLYHSLNESISLQQAQESQLKDLQRKHMVLEKQTEGIMTLKTVSDDSLAAANSTHQLEMKIDKAENKLRAKMIAVDDSNLTKRRKLSKGNIDDSSVSLISRNSQIVIDERKTVRPAKFAAAQIRVPPSLPSTAKTNAIPATGALKEEKDPTKIVGRFIQRTFPGHGIFLGRIASYKRPYYTIKYDDGDKEEMTIIEVMEWLDDSS